MAHSCAVVAEVVPLISNSFPVMAIQYRQAPKNGVWDSHKAGRAQSRAVLGDGARVCPLGARGADL